jgi:hypothetical protein
VSFYRILVRLSAQLLLGIAVFLWGAIALLDVERPALRPWFGLGCATAVLALVCLSRSWRWGSWAGALALLFPIGILAHANGASPWLWLFWIVAALATERWLRDGFAKGPDAAG